MMRINFAATKTTRSGSGSPEELYRVQVSPSVQFLKPLQSGARILEAKNYKDDWVLPEEAVKKLNEETRGAFLELMGGKASPRFLALKTQKEMLEKLGRKIPHIINPTLKEFLRVFLNDAKLVLKEYDDRATLIIVS